MDGEGIFLFFLLLHSFLSQLDPAIGLLYERNLPTPRHFLSLRFDSRLHDIALNYFLAIVIGEAFRD
jgi:hypothetical protein